MIGHAADSHAVEVAAENGLNLASHRARQVEPGMIHAADLVLTMEKLQRDEMVKLVPWCTGKIWRIGHYAGMDVADPYRQGKKSFELAFHTITRLGQTWLSFAKVP